MRLCRVQSAVSQCLVYKLSLELQDLIMQLLKRTMMLSYTVFVQAEKQTSVERASKLARQCNTCIPASDIHSVSESCC